MKLDGKYIVPAATGLLVVILLCYAIRFFLLRPGESDFLLPLPGEIISAFWQERRILFNAAGETLIAALSGFLLAVVCGFTLAVILSSGPWIRRSLYPWIHVLQMTPVIVLIPFLILWIGPGLPSIIAITFLISFFPVVASTTQGLLSTPETHRDLFRLYNANHWQKLLWLRVPFALPYFFNGLKISATLAVIGALTGEFFAGSSNGSSGLGFLIIIYKSQFKIDALAATALLACLLGLSFTGVVAVLRWYALRHWHESIDRDFR